MTAPQMNRPEPLDFSVLGPPTPDGVYFGLPEDDYHAAGAFSNSGVSNISVSPLTYWAKNIDPNREEDAATPAQTTGKAFHKRILEGEEAFLENFAVLPENDGEHLAGATELKARCAELDLKKGGTIADLCARIREADPEAKLWPEVLAAFNEENTGKSIIKPETWVQIELPARFIRSHPTAGKAFQGGYPEVSIFWTEDGLPWKSRVDYLKTKALVDLKTFENLLGLPVDAAVSRSIANYRWHVQAFIYLRAVTAAKKLVRDGKVFGNASEEWLEAFAKTPAHKFMWVFIQKGRIPEVKVRGFSRTLNGREAGDNLYYQDAQRKVEVAVSALRQCVEFYGPDPDVMWVMPEPTRDLIDEDLPLWLFG